MLVLNATGPNSTQPATLAMPLGTVKRTTPRCGASCVSHLSPPFPSPLHGTCNVPLFEVPPLNIVPSNSLLRTSEFYKSRSAAASGGRAESCHASRDLR